VRNAVPKTTLEDILRAAQIGETTDWEFKSARGGFPGGFWDTYSAMANSEGGIVVLGVREGGGKAQLDGLSPEQVARYQKTLWDGLNNRGQVSLNLLTPSDVGIVEAGKARLLVIRIPRAARAQRPVHLGGNPLGNTYRRQHEGDYRCRDAEVRRMLADADPTPADHRILSNFVPADLDAASLTQYRQRLRAAKGDHPWLALENQALLERLGGWRQDRASGKSGLTLAGLLMFGKHQAIRDPEAAPEFFVDYREKLDPGTRWSDRLYPDGTWEANLFQFYQRAWPKLSAALPVPFQLEGGVRRDETPVHEALREAFVNALIHADYAVPGGVVLERHADRFVMENPGTLLVSLEQYHRGGVSECRNKALQQMFLLIGGGERAGSGADKIRAGWRSQRWRAPLIITLPMVSLIPDATLERLRAVFGARLDTLSPAEIQALATADLEDGVSNARLQELLSDHPVDITRILQRLCEQGYLLSDNRGRWTRYRLSGTTPEAADSSHLPADSLQLPGDSSHLAEPVSRSKKASARTMRKSIIDLCSGRYLTAEQLAGLLQRNSAGLRDRYLTPLVREGLLQLRYPGTTTRPDQAYTAVRQP
jgi:ATP-dependent DNA helicase RecG